MSAEFEEFARAASAKRGNTGPELARLSRVAVLGGGPDARLLAALALSEGCDVTLFSAYGAELEQMRASSGIALLGAGPIGTYKVGDGADSVRLTAELDSAVKDAEIIFLTGPIHKQRTYAMVLADHIENQQILVVPNARTFGAIEVSWMLRLGGFRKVAHVVEMIGMPYWFSAKGNALTLSKAGKLTASTLPHLQFGRVQTVETLVGDMHTPNTVLHSGFSDLSAAVEIPALVLGGAALNGGGPKVPMGATGLPENDTFAALIGDQQRGLIEMLAAERRAVAAAFGVRDLPDTDDWINGTAGAARGPQSRPVPGQIEAQALMRDGVIGSLVPLVSAAQLAGIDVPQTESLIRMTEALLDADVAGAGRRLDTLGIATSGVDDARRDIEAIGLSGGAD